MSAVYCNLGEKTNFTKPQRLGPNEADAGIFLEIVSRVATQRKARYVNRCNARRAT